MRGCITALVALVLLVELSGLAPLTTPAHAAEDTPLDFVVFLESARNKGRGMSNRMVTGPFILHCRSNWGTETKGITKCLTANRDAVLAKFQREAHKLVVIAEPWLLALWNSSWSRLFSTYEIGLHSLVPLCNSMIYPRNENGLFTPPESVRNYDIRTHETPFCRTSGCNWRGSAAPQSVVMHYAQIQSITPFAQEVCREIEIHLQPGDRFGTAYGPQEVLLPVVLKVTPNNSVDPILTLSPMEEGSFPEIFLRSLTIATNGKPRQVYCMAFDAARMGQRKAFSFRGELRIEPKLLMMECKRTYPPITHNSLDMFVVFARNGVACDAHQILSK